MCSISCSGTQQKNIATKLSRSMVSFGTPKLYLNQGNGSPDSAMSAKYRDSHYRRMRGFRTNDFNPVMNRYKWIRQICYGRSTLEALKPALTSTGPSQLPLSIVARSRQHSLSTQVRFVVLGWLKPFQSGAVAERNADLRQSEHAHDRRCLLLSRISSA